MPFDVCYILLLLFLLNCSLLFHLFIICFNTILFSKFGSSKPKAFLRVLIFLSFHFNLRDSNILFMNVYLSICIETKIFLFGRLICLVLLFLFSYLNLLILLRFIIVLDFKRHNLIFIFFNFITT